MMSRLLALAAALLCATPAHAEQKANALPDLRIARGTRGVAEAWLADPTIATFEDDAGAYDQKDAGGFIKLNALRLRIAANLKAKGK